MIRKHLLLCVFGIFAWFIASAFGREAILGGVKAKDDQFPYQVTLLFNDLDECGGGIIGEQHILTTAHCVLEHNGHFSRSRIYVLAGTNSLLKTDSPAEKIQVKKVYVLKEYNSTVDEADIAVLKLKHPLKLSKHISKLELPNKYETYANTVAMLAGFGFNMISIDEHGNEHGKNTDTYLRYAITDVLSPSHPNYCKNTIYDRQICARVRQHLDNFTRGACNGDSGSPLVHDGKTAIGLLVRTPTSCTEKIFGSIYTRVSHYLDFIQLALHDKNNFAIRTHVYL